MSRPASLSRNVTSSWAGIVLGIVYALIITPIAVQALDTQLYGAWSWLNDILAYSELFYLGLGSAIIRYVAEARARNDQARINRLVSVFLSIYTAIGILCLLILLLLSTRITAIFPDPLSPEAARAVAYTCVLLGVRVFLVFVGSAFSGLMSGHDRFDLVNGVGMASAVIRFIAIPLLIHPDREPLLTLAVVVCATSVLETATLAVIAFRYVKGLSVSLVKPKLDELRLLYGFGLPSFFVLFAFKLISYTDSTVIGITLGLASVAVYSFPLQIVGYARMCVGGFSGVLLPRLTLLATLNDLPGLRQAYLNSARIGCFIAGWLGGVVITLGPPFLNRWIGPEYGPPSEMVLVWLTVAAFAQALSTQVAYPFYQALHIVRFPAMVLTLEGLVNLALTIYLAPRLGITGVAIATAVPAVFVSLAILPVTLCRKLGLPLWALIVRSVVPGLVMLLATWASQALVATYVTTDSYTIIVVRGMMTVPVALAVFFTTFPVEERHAIERLLRLRAG